VHYRRYVAIQTTENGFAFLVVQFWVCPQIKSQPAQAIINISLRCKVENSQNSQSLGTRLISSAALYLYIKTLCETADRFLCGYSVEILVGLFATQVLSFIARDCSV
jgi:hypothetical protein